MTYTIKTCNKTQAIIKQNKQPKRYSPSCEGLSSFSEPFM